MIIGLNELYAALRGDAHAERPETVEPFKQALGRTIAEVDIGSSMITISFADHTSLSFYDNQSCCESRYFTCPDDLQQLIGARFMDVQQRHYTPPPAAPDAVPEDDWGVDRHEQSFLEIVTNRASITVTAHNVHNGYYGGFDLNMLFHGAGFSNSTED